MSKMDVDDVVDLSLGSGRDSALTITPTTTHNAGPQAITAGLDLPALTLSNSGVTISPATPTNYLNINNNNNNNSSSNINNCNNSNNMNNDINSNEKNSNYAIGENTKIGITSQLMSTITPNNSNNGGSESVGVNNNINMNEETTVQRRVLRPRTEPKSYAEAPDIVILPSRMNGRQQNGNIDSETDDDEMPAYVPMKELTSVELKELEEGLRKLREDLRHEETKLILLKKLKQSQHIMKENLIVTPTSISPMNPLVGLPATLASKGCLSVTPTTALMQSSKGRAANSSIPMVTVK